MIGEHALDEMLQRANLALRQVLRQIIQRLLDRCAVPEFIELLIAEILEHIIVGGVLLALAGRSQKQALEKNDAQLEDVRLLFTQVRQLAVCLLLRLRLVLSLV